MGPLNVGIIDEITDFGIRALTGIRAGIVERTRLAIQRHILVQIELTELGAKDLLEVPAIRSCRCRQPTTRRDSESRTLKFFEGESNTALFRYEFIH